MCHGADRRDAVISFVKGAGRCVTAADISRSCAVNGGVEALRTAGTEFHYGSVAGGTLDAVGFCCNQALMIDGKKNHGFNQLCLNHGTSDGDNRLTRENRRSLGNRPDIAGKLEIAKIIEKFICEAFFLQKGKILLREAEILKIVKKLTDACHDGKAAVIGNLSEEHIKPGNFVFHAVLEIAVCHCQLIEIHEHCEIS